MANTKSAEKRIRVIAKRTLRNRIWKSGMRTAVRRFDAALQAGDERLTELFRKAVSIIDKAAAKGVIHKNAASRKKARLSKRLSKQAS